jgi:hypothetical protein
MFLTLQFRWKIFKKQRSSSDKLFCKQGILQRSTICSTFSDISLVTFYSDLKRMQSKLLNYLLRESRLDVISIARNIWKRSVCGGKLKYFLTVWSRFVNRLQIRSTSLINQFICSMRVKTLKIIQDAGNNGLRFT